MRLPRSVCLAAALCAAVTTAAVPLTARSAFAAPAIVDSAAASTRLPAPIDTAFDLTRVNGFASESSASLEGTSSFTGWLVAKTLTGKELGRQHASGNSVFSIPLYNDDEPIGEVVRVVAIDTNGVPYAPRTVVLPRIEDWGKLPPSPTVAAIARTSDSVRLALGSQLTWDSTQTLVVRGPDGKVLQEIPRTGYDQTAWIGAIPESASMLSVTLRTTKDGRTAESRPTLFTVRAAGAPADEATDPVFARTDITSPSAFTPGTHTVVAGTASPDAQVFVHTAGTSRARADAASTDSGWKAEGSVRADEHGEWSVVTDVLPASTSRMRVVQVSGGNLEETESALSAAEDEAFVPTTITSGTVVEANTPFTLSGEATPNANVVVSVPGIDLSELVHAGDDGTWSLRMRGLPGGTYSGHVTQASVHGSDDLDFSVSAVEDLTDPFPDAPFAPAAITSELTYDNGADYVLTGTATPGARVVVEVPGLPRTERPRADADGRWSVTFPHLTGSFLGNTVTQVTDKGDDEPIRFDIDARLEFTSPAPGKPVDVKRPVFGGVGHSGWTVRVTDEQHREIGTTVIDGTGHWQVTSPVDFDNGEHTADVTQTAPTR